MTFKKTRLAESVAGPLRTRNDDIDLASREPNKTRYQAILASADPSNPELERRMRARAVWEFLDESKSTFYARLNPNNPDSFDPLFPQPIRSSSNGSGPKRWKLGSIIAWLRHCEANAQKS